MLIRGLCIHKSGNLWDRNIIVSLYNVCMFSFRFQLSCSQPPGGRRSSVGCVLGFWYPDGLACYSKCLVLILVFNFVDILYCVERKIKSAKSFQVSY